jgi:hypothetical protein
LICKQATKANATTRTVIAEIQHAGKTTLAAIAAELDARSADPGRSIDMGTSAGVEVDGGLMLGFVPGRRKRPT